VKILHVVNSLEPGGMENGIVNLAHGLEPRGFAIHVACLERRGAFAERLPVPERVVVLGKRRGFSPSAALQLAHQIDLLRPDIVHSHNLGALIYSSLATLGGSRCVLIQGEHSQLSDDERSPRRLRQRRWLYRGCRAIHTVSEAMREELIACGFPAGKISAIANGVDTARFTPGDRRAARQALSLPADTVFIGIFGRFGPFKRHGLLLEAFEQIAPRFPAAHLLVVGAGGPEEAAITARARTSIFHERIHLAGFQDDPRNCYRALDLLAIPSVNEGLSNVALEAMACGIPALVQAGCGHEQVITPGMDGWIETLDSPDALATRLAELLAQPSQFVDFGANARKKVESQFSLAPMLHAYERLYRACAPSPH
jgi:glycosyltransferase involved in cell wall biosynthesis